MQFEGEDLTSNSQLVRHCRNWQLRNDKSAPIFLAFLLRHKINERYLSFSWLEKVCQITGIPVDHEAGIEELQENFHLDLTKDKDLWAICRCELLSSIVLEVVGSCPKIYIVSTDDPTHIGVEWQYWDDRAISRSVAEKIIERIECIDIYPVTKTIESVTKRGEKGFRA